MKNLELSNQIAELSTCEYIEISGGDEWSESVTRLMGYIYQSLRDIDWTQSSWSNNPRAQR